MGCLASIGLVGFATLFIFMAANDPKNSAIWFLLSAGSVLLMVVNWIGQFLRSGVRLSGRQIRKWESEGLVRHNKIAGVTFKNLDGTSRQKLLGRCRPREQLLFIRDPSNPHDPNAVAIHRASGEQLGYVPASMAEEIADDIRRRCIFAVWIAERTGGGLLRSRGCNFAYTIIDSSSPEAEQIQRWSKDMWDRLYRAKRRR